MEKQQSDMDKQPRSAGVGLFRQQALDHATSRPYGTVILSQYLSHRVVTGAFFLLAVGIIFFISFFETTRKAQGTGVLLPVEGLVRVKARELGVVAEVYVKEGESVSKGDLLFVLSSERPIKALGSAEEAVAALLRNRRDSYQAEVKESKFQSEKRRLAVQQKVKALLEERSQLSAQITLQRSRVGLVTKALVRLQELQDRNYIAPAQLEDKEADLIDQRQRLSDLQRLLVINSRELAAAEAEYGDQQIQARREEAGLERNAYALQQELAETEARRGIRILAPKDGVVSAISTNVGQTVSPDAVLATILPAGAELEAEIFVPSNAAGFVKPGTPVLLRYQAYPYQKFGQYPATVHEVAMTSQGVDELAMRGGPRPVTQSTEPLYRIRLKLRGQFVVAYGKPIRLKSGMLVEASFLLDHRRLYEWILDPLFSISGRG